MRGSAAASSTRFGTLKPASDSAQWRRSSSGLTSEPSCEHDDRGHRLLPLRVLAADHGGVGDLGVAQQHFLDFRRHHVLAAGDDHVVHPVLDVEEAFLVDATEVAGVQPAVGVGAAGGDGRALDEDLAVLDAQVGGQQRPPGGAELAAGLGGCQRRHLRAGLGQAVGLHDRGAASERLLERVLGHRPAADQNSARAGEVGAGLEQPGQHRRHQRDHGDLIALQRLGDPVDVEAVVDHRRGAVDHRAHHDPEAGDVAERQAAEPAVLGLDADVEGRGDGAPEEVAVGEADRIGRAGAAAGHHPWQATSSMSCSPSSGRSASVWVSSPASSRSTAGSSAAITAARSSAESRGPSGSSTAPTFIRAWTITTCSRRGCIVIATVEPRRTPWAVEAARHPGRLRLELGVGDLGAVGDQGGALGAALRSLGQPVVEFHRRDIVPIMPKRHKEAPPEETLYAPIEWQSAGEYDDIRYEKADGIAKITHRPAGGRSTPSGPRR